MIQDLHTHTIFCDGNNTAEEMVVAALELGIDRLGFSGHSYTAFDSSFCMSEGNTRAYKREIKRLKEKYDGVIKILMGVEQEYFSEASTRGYDYVIGSLHYVEAEGQYLSVDDTEEVAANIVKSFFDGDWYAYTARYFEIVSDVVNRTGADIIGHLDLVTKFNEGNRFFDESDERYLESAYRAIEKLVKHGVAFEINTGAMSRGYRSEPYPGPLLRQHIIECGGSFILSSDAHSTDGLLYGFDEYRHLVGAD